MDQEALNPLSHQMGLRIHLVGRKAAKDSPLMMRLCKTRKSIRAMDPEALNPESSNVVENSSCEENGSEGFPFDCEVTPTEEVNLSDVSRTLESPDLESSNVVKNSSRAEKCNSSNHFCSNTRDDKAQHLSVDVAATTSRQPSPEPSPLESGLPFIKSSFMWPQFESMEVFLSLPQQPHFNPLMVQDEYLREGAAIGLMLSFTQLVEATRMAQLDDSGNMFDTKLKALQFLEEHGFAIQPIRTQLVELLRIKESCGQLNCKLKTVTREVNEELESVALLDKDIQMLKERRKMKAFKVAELQGTSEQIEESIRAARSNFDTLVAAPW
ncbi:hypothetical protein AQUCO_01600309v1 [Aquilegia coerulea]|uniref:DUF724 domain-containing protein n=1 Tax=Aquilegia coerulea TaxID=218851 RepID=A0A2G5DR15_AQUCA|nr:hypothetical protein AQUCO_01600309v1 [Aquilegia coerulea]